MDNENVQESATVRTDTYTPDVTNADAIFIPSNIEGKDDYLKYKVGMYRTVPENCYLVSVNRLTGKMINRGGRGFKIMPPFVTKSVFVPNIDRTIDYRPMDFKTHDDIHVDVDMALTIKVVDPVKYLKEGKNQLAQLNKITQSLLRVYIQKRDFEDLVSGLCPIEQFSPKKNFDGQTGKPILNPPLSAYEQFEQDYGIKIVKVHIGTIKLPKNLEEQYDNRVEEEKKKEAQAVRLQAEKEKAEREAEIVGIKAKAEAERIRTVGSAEMELDINKKKKLFEFLNSMGFSVGDYQEYLKFQEMSKNQNSAFFYGANDQVRNVSAGVGAANSYNQRRNKNVSTADLHTSVKDDQSKASTTSQSEPLSNSDRLKNDLFARVSLGRFSNESYEQIMGLLQDANRRDAINRLDVNGYNKLVQSFLEEERSYQAESFSGRGR